MKRLKNLKTVVPPVFILFFTVYFLAEPELAADAIRRGLIMCGSTVIPSLFPFMTLSSFIARSGAAEKLGRVFSPVTRKVFGLPPECSACIIMGLVGGYPTGVKTAYEMYSGGIISKESARRLMLFCVNAGPSFVTGAVGLSIYGNEKIGTIFAVSCVVSSLLMGVILRFGRRGRVTEESGKIKSPRTKLTEAFVLAAADSSAAMISICTWVLIFQSFSSCIYLLKLPEKAMSCILPALEITTGVQNAAAGLSPEAVCAFLAFAGLSVHCQLMKYIRGADLGYIKFLASRIVHALLASGVCFLLLRIFPCGETVFSNGAVSLPETLTSSSVPAAAALLLMCVIFIMSRTESSFKA